MGQSEASTLLSLVVPVAVPVAVTTRTLLICKRLRLTVDARVDASVQLAASKQYLFF